MEKYILFDYSLLLDDEGEECIDSVIVAIIDPQDSQQNEEVEHRQIQKKDNFQKLIVDLLTFINEEAVKFNNVLLVAPSTKFFTFFLEEEFRRRNLDMLFVFQNYLDIQKEFKRTEGFELKSISQMAEYYKEHQLWSNISKMKAILKRVNLKKRTKELQSSRKESENPQAIIDSSQKQRPSPEHSQSSQISKEQKKLELWQSEQLYKSCVPIQSSEEQSNINFSCDFAESKQIDNKNKSLSPLFKPRKDSYNNKKPAQRKYFEGGKKYPIFSTTLENNQDNLIRNAIRIRGLPFNMKESQIEELFHFFKPIPLSLKVGRPFGQKTGQAVLLFPSQNLAEGALDLNGLQIYGRFLEVMLISSQSYNRFS